MIEGSNFKLLWPNLGFIMSFLLKCASSTLLTWEGLSQFNLRIYRFDHFH